MADVIFIAIILVFFGLSALFVKFCDRIIGSDEEALAQRVTGEADGQADEEQAA